MYAKVRYARVTSATLKESAKVFRLKRDGKNLPTSEYGENLKTYLDDSESVATLTLDDLNSVLTRMSESMNTEVETVLEGGKLHEIVGLAVISLKVDINILHMKRSNSVSSLRDLTHEFGLGISNEKRRNSFKPNIEK